METRNTIPTGLIPRDKIDEKNYTLLLREALHNTLDHGGKNIYIKYVNFDDNKYIAICQDAEPFESFEDIKNSMKIAQSKGNGIQGSGGKISMFYVANSEYEAEYIVLSKTKENGLCAVSLTCQQKDGRGRDALVTDKSYIIDCVMEQLNCNFAYNNIYLYKDTLAKDKEKRALNKDLFQLLNICPEACDRLNISFDNSNDFRHLVLPKSDYFFSDNFVAHTETINIPKINLEKNGKSYEFESVLKIDLIPHITIRYCFLRLKTGERENLFSSFQTNTFVYANADDTRSLDAVYFDKTNLLNDEFNIPSDLSSYKDRISDIYKGIDMSLIDKSYVTWRPIVKLSCYINPISMDCKNIFNNVNCCFDVDNRDDQRILKDMIREAISNIPLDTKIKLSKVFEIHFPFDVSDLLPLSYDKAFRDQLVSVEAVDSTSGEKIKKIELDKMYNVKIRDIKTKEYIGGNGDLVANTVPTNEFIGMSEVDGTFDIWVRKLGFNVRNLIFTYKTANSRKKYCISNILYDLAIDDKEDKPKGSKKNNKKDNKNDSLYVNMEEKLLVRINTDDIVMFNSGNPIIRDIFINDRPEYREMTARTLKIVERIKDLAYEEKNNFDFIYNDVSFNKNNIKKWNNEEGREHYYNFRIKKLIESDREIQKLIEDKKKIKEKYNLDNPEKENKEEVSKAAIQTSLL